MKTTNIYEVFDRNLACLIESEKNNYNNNKNNQKNTKRTKNKLRMIISSIINSAYCEYSVNLTIQKYKVILY